MNKMEQGILQVDPRHTTRRIRTAMQGNVIRALVELITNSDDSYRRLEDENIRKKGLIELSYGKDGYRGLFAVRDYASGMSLDLVRKGLTTYGAATSGMQEGKSSRGYFGHGAKDALASMLDGKICTFKDDNFVEYRIFTKNNKVYWQIDPPALASAELRRLHEVEGDGTIAYFNVDPHVAGRVPRFDTLCKDLANNYLLRKIMTNPQRHVLLLDDKDGDTRRLKYQMPRGDEILAEDFTISYGEFGDFPVHISLWRAEHELTQSGDDREGGLLLVDEEDAVLGMSLFKYDPEALAARFFGEVRIGNFRRLLNEEEPVLREERDGLIARHPFCQALIPEIERRIEKQVKVERLRRQKENQSKIDSDEAKRYKKAFSILNKIAEIEVQSVTNLGKDPSTELEQPQNGFCFYPASSQITVGKRYAFELRLDTNIVRHGSIIKLSSTNTKIRVLTSDIKLLPQDGSGVLSKYVTVEGSEPNVDGILRAVAGNNISEAKVFVVPEKGGLLYEEGLEFEPGSLTLHPNQKRKGYLLVYVKMIQGGSAIKISSDNESIHVSERQIVVNEADAKRHVAKYELEFWGEGIGEDAVITAEFDSFMALLDVHVRSKREAPEKNRKGMFNEPEFAYDSEPPQRTSYSYETGTVNIYVNFPSVKHYLGGDCRYRKTLPAQVLVADLVAERCFYEMAKRKVGTRVGVTLGPEAVPDRIQRDAQELSCKYGQLVHEALVDQALFKKTKNGLDD
jgi:hypothetical protein